MNSQWFRTFGLAAIASVAITVTVAAAEPVFLGYGTNPQWSPSGELIGAWRGDTLVVFDVTARKEIKTISVERPKFFYWLSEDSIALSYQGRTKAARPRDRETIVTHAVLDLNGHFTQLASDTLEDERNYITHWRKLPNGKVGAFKLQNGVATKFYVPGGDGFVEADPDTSSRSLCWQNVPGWVRVYHPSPDCTLALAYTTADEAVLLDPSGEVLHSFGSRVLPIEGGRFTGISRPTWSSNGSYLAYTKFTEDGHYLHSTEIVAVSTSNYESVNVAKVMGEAFLSCIWAPSDAALALAEQGRILIWRPEH